MTPSRAATRTTTTTRAGTPHPPLARLLAIAYRALVDDLHSDLRERGWRDVRPAYGFVLLAARERTTTSSEIASLMGITKQAASKLVDGMAAAGYVARGGETNDARRKPVSLTPRGEALLGTVEEIYARLEGQWAQVIGAGAMERLRDDLVAVLTSNGERELPAVRPAV